MMTTELIMYEPTIMGYPRSFWLRYWLAPMIASECSKHTFHFTSDNIVRITKPETLEIIIENAKDEGVL